MSDGRKFLHGQVVAMDLATLQAYQHILATIDAEKLEQLAARHLAKEPQAAAGAAGGGGAVAVIPVYGMLTHRPDIFGLLFGGTSMTRLTTAFRMALANPEVKAIVLDVASGGGQVAGLAELAREVRMSRGAKPIVAVVNSMAASAAYWLASAADEIVATITGEAGSIGTYLVHVNEKPALEGEGLEVTLFAAGELKPSASGLSKLTPEEAAAWQARADAAYALFTGELARNRGVALETVRKGYGRGAILPAAAAKAEGLVDRIATLDETVARLSSGAGRRSAMSAGAALRERAVALGMADELPERLPDDPPEAPAPPPADVPVSADRDPRTRRLAAKLKTVRD